MIWVSNGVDKCDKDDMSYTKEQLKEIEIQAERQAYSNGFDFDNNTPVHVARDLTSQMDTYIQKDAIDALAAFIGGLKKAQEKRQVRINATTKKDVNKGLKAASAVQKYDGRFTWYIRAFTRMLAIEKGSDEEVAKKVCKDRLMRWLDLGLSVDSATSFDAAVAAGQIDVAMRIKPAITEVMKLSKILDACMKKTKGRVLKVNEEEFAAWWQVNKSNVKVEASRIIELIRADQKPFGYSFNVVLKDLIMAWCAKELKRKSPGRADWQSEIAQMCAYASCNDLIYLQLTIDALKIGLGEKNQWMILEPKKKRVNDEGWPIGPNPLIDFDRVNRVNVQIEGWTFWCLNRRLVEAAEVWQKNGIPELSVVSMKSLLSKIDSELKREDVDLVLDELKLLRSSLQKKMLMSEIQVVEDKQNRRLAAL